MSHPQKKLNLSHPDNQNHNEDAVAGPSNDESPPDIFKLNIDCLDEIFEYLNVKDLHSFGQTCKRMNKVAGEYFKQNYSSFLQRCEKDGIYMSYSDKDGVLNERIQTSGFNKFMPCIKVCGNDYRKLRYIQSHAIKFESTKLIFHVGFDINNEHVEHFKQLLPKLEILCYICCRVDGNLYDLMLKYCKNLREINIRTSIDCIRINGKLNWLLQEYPKLECLELIPIDPENSCRVEELREFFVRNRNVQRFSTTERFLFDNGDIFLNSNAKLDILGINRIYFSKKTPLELLNRLHEQGFYKRLHIYVESVYEKFCTLLASLKGLELLYIERFQRSDNLAQLTNLRELIISRGSNAEDAEILANGLTKLERLYINRASIDEIMPFICRSPKLNKIKFIPRDKGVVLNLAMLNTERAKLAEARKITIYTRDDVFLATKWTTRNGDTNLSFIEMRRADSYVWRAR